MCVCGGCGSPCSFFPCWHRCVCVCVSVSADVVQGIFSFAVFSSSLSAAWRGGWGLQRNHNCLHPLVKCQPLDHRLQQRVTVKKPVCVCVCFAFALSPAFSYRHLTLLLWGYLHISLVRFSVVSLRLLKRFLCRRLPAASTRNYFNNEINVCFEEQFLNAALWKLQSKL